MEKSTIREILDERKPKFSKLKKPSAPVRYTTRELKLSYGEQLENRIGKQLRSYEELQGELFNLKKKIWKEEITLRLITKISWKVEYKSLFTKKLEGDTKELLNNFYEGASKNII